MTSFRGRWGGWGLKILDFLIVFIYLIFFFESLNNERICSNIGPWRGDPSSSMLKLVIGLLSIVIPLSFWPKKKSWTEAAQSKTGAYMSICWFWKYEHHPTHTPRKKSKSLLPIYIYIYIYIMLICWFS